MKTFSKFIIAIAAISTLSSCIKDEIKNVYYVGTQNYVYDFSVKPREWEKLDNPGAPGVLEQAYYSRTVEVDGLDKYAFNYGQVNCYLDYGDAQQILPSTRHYREIDPGTGDEVFYTVTTDFEFSEGYVTVYYTASDYCAVRPAEEMFFRLVISVQYPD